MTGARQLLDSREVALPISRSVDAEGRAGANGSPSLAQTLRQREAAIEHIRGLLRFRQYLLDDGMTDVQIQRLVRQQRFVRVIPGCYVAQDQWRQLHIEDRILARTLAIAHGARTRRGQTPVFSHQSAAAIWGLPLYGCRNIHAHVLTSRDARGRRNESVIRHSTQFTDLDTCEVAGLTVTSVSRTVLDLARLGTRELAVASADAALRMLFGAGRDARPASVAAWQEEQFETLARMRGSYGVAAAREVLRFADPRADSVLESVSRVHLRRLRIAAEIQVKVPGVHGKTYWVDFAFTDQQAFGEVDGAVKYSRPDYLSGLRAEEVLLAEKEREDQIRGVTGHRIVRWTARDCASAAKLGARLKAFGLRVPAFE